ncbi:MAG: TIGR01459 family HAD-type hydrolase [Alphaproteobacteria bacterium]|nr:TIGR01459 family HAD-type hydrolase [Alphaproteobacteria bacterium]
MPNTKFCHGISDISDSYTGFIIDTWGVLHDTERVFDGAVECLKELKARKKFVLLMSNSELDAAHMRISLKELGLAENLYSDILTSGELLSYGIKTQKDGVFEGMGKNCYLIGGDRARKFLEDNQVKIVKYLEDASFMLISGWDYLEGDIASYETLLREAIRKKIKILCINPDSRALLGNNYKTATVNISRRIQELGGVVHMIGKPYKPIFYHAIHILHRNGIYPGQTVMVGDTMAHDIVGASLVNMDTCLVRSGMHAPIFKNSATPADVNKALNILVNQYNNVRPTYLVDRLKWGKALPDRKHKKRAG